MKMLSLSLNLNFINKIFEFEFWDWGLIEVNNSEFQIILE